MNDDPRLLDRRSLLRGATALGGLALLPGGVRAGIRFASPPLGERSEDSNLLLVLELSGGNDGLNTVVPYGDDLYAANRQVNRIPTDGLLVLDEYRGLNPLLARHRELWDRGELAIVEGVGYPEPNRSHFTSLDIWHSASREGRLAGSGWVGRLLGALGGSAGQPNRVVHVGQKLPYSLRHPEHPVVCFEQPSSYRWADAREPVEKLGSRGAGEAGGRGSNLDRLRGLVADAAASSADVRRAVGAYRTDAPYPAGDFGRAMKTAAALFRGDVGCQVVSVALPGFDTHENQPDRHAQLLELWDAGLGALFDDVRGTSVEPRLTVMVYSEFGRRVAENGSRGTDHGAAGPMFLAGARVRGGLHGEHPSLAELVDGDLVYGVDFRSVYASVLKDGFGVEPTAVLDAEYSTLPLFQA